MKKKSSISGSRSRILACLGLTFLLGGPVALADMELEKQLKEVVTADTALSPEAKNKLVSIIESVTQQNTRIEEKIREQKVQLLKALLAQPPASGEVKEIRRSLVKLNDERLENSLKALESLKDVLGHQKNPEILFNKILQTGGR